MQTNENNEQDKRKKYNFIKAIIILFIIALIIAGIYIFYTKNNAASQITELKSNVSNGNYKDLAKQLSTNNRQMTNDESKHLINYFKKNENASKFDDEIKDIKENLDKENQTSEIGSITDKNNDEIIGFSKNGKKFLILDKISMKPIYRDVYVKELDNTATYNFGEKHKVSVKKNRINNIGTFIVGDYDVPVEKVFEDAPVKGNLNGKIHINTNERQDNKHIIADQNFKQTKVRIKIHNDSKLENTKVYINDTPYKSDEDRTYGYLPNDSSFSIKATGKIDDNLFRTNNVNVTENISGNLIVNLQFDEKEIKSKIKKDKALNKDITKFIKSYMLDLNKAYVKTDYKYIKDDIKSNSNAESFMKPKFDTKQKIKYSDTKINEIKKEDDLYKVDVTKKYKANLVKTTYYIEKNESQFQITKMEDKT